MKNAIVGQSGGPTAAINASLAGVIAEAAESNNIDKIYGMLHGIMGFLEENIVELNSIAENKDDIELLCKTPSSYLGSCRYKLPKDEKDALYDKIFDILDKYNIGYFFYIGGNDSMDTISKLSKQAKCRNSAVKFVGVPKTIDNDLPCTDHTPGFGSAAKYIATTVREISADSFVYNENSVTIVEIMGRNAGWLTGASVLAKSDGLGPDLIYLPERTFSFEEFNKRITEILKTKKNIIVAISEGAKTADGKYVCEAESSGVVDVFGHKYLGGTARVLENYVREQFNYKARGIELNVPQRCAGHLLSKTDIDESMKVGAVAVRAALSGVSGAMMIYERVSNSPYEIKYNHVDIDSVANIEKIVPSDFINERGDNVTEKFVEYVSPLVQGEVSPEFENGMPKLLVLKK